MVKTKEKRRTIKYKNRNKKFDTSILALYRNSTDDDILRLKQENQLIRKLGKITAPKFITIVMNNTKTGGTNNVSNTSMGKRVNKKASSHKNRK